MSGPLHIAAITRFSIVHPQRRRTFARTIDLTIEQARAVIFDPARMGRRFDLFAAFTLPSLAAMAGRYDHFLHVILTSAEMPGIFRERLDDLVGDLPWCHVLTLDEAPSTWDQAAALIGEKTRGDPVFTLRIDDDDAIGTDYLPAVLDHGDAPDGTVLSFDSGFEVEARDDGYAIACVQRPNIALGLGAFSRASPLRTVHHYGNHATLGDRTPVVHRSDRPYWIRTMHSFSDAGRRAASEHELSIGDAIETLRPYFGTIDLGRALAVLARLRSDA